MLVLDAETLAKHFVRGSLSKEQFATLSASLAMVEKDIRNRNLLVQFFKLFQCPRELRNYTIKWRIKSAWRTTKRMALLTLLLALAVVWRVDSDDLVDMWEAGFDVVQLATLVIDGRPEPLPEDIQLAVDYLSNNPDWERLHVREIKTRWLDIDAEEKAVIRKTHWFQEFSLLVEVKKIEQQKQLRNGNIDVVRSLAELRELSDALA
jgi:hypothetical protein